jgi:hypothetical protein
MSLIFLPNSIKTKSDSILPHNSKLILNDFYTFNFDQKAVAMIGIRIQLD